jgi:hypothetical protein
MIWVVCFVATGGTLGYFAWATSSLRLALGRQFTEMVAAVLAGRFAAPLRPMAEAAGILA